MQVPTPRVHPQRFPITRQNPQPSSSARLEPELTTAGVKLNIGGSVHDRTDPVGRLLLNVLAMIAEFESDLIRMRTREGMKVAKAKGRLRGKATRAQTRAGGAPRRAVVRQKTHQRRAR